MSDKGVVFIRSNPAGRPVGFTVSSMTVAEHAELDAICNMARCRLDAQYDVDRGATHLRIYFPAVNKSVDSLHFCQPSRLSEFRDAVALALATLQTESSNRSST